jgi:hypothetical protein
VLVTIGAVVLVAIGAAVFAARPELGQFCDAGAIASGLDKHVRPVPGVLFALGLLDACIIGAAAVSLSIAYAIGDVLDLRHFLHRKTDRGQDVLGSIACLRADCAGRSTGPDPGTPLGLLTNAVQTLAGVLLPSATFFFLLLCNDKAVLGPWVNNRWLNLFTGAVIALLVMLSMILLTPSILYPEISGEMIIDILVASGVATVATFVGVSGFRRRGRAVNAPDDRLLLRDSWRMPPLDALPPRRLTWLDRVWLTVLRAYLLLAAGLVLVRIVTLATAGLRGQKRGRLPR